MNTPLIVAYYDGDSEVQILSNFANTPFTLDGISYLCVEGFWQSLKTEDQIIRQRFSHLGGLDAKQLGNQIKSGAQVFTYKNKLYRVGSQQHHILLERAIRAKTEQNPQVVESFRLSGWRPLKHMLKNKYNQWRPGDSPSLPAIAFENILLKLREELALNKFTPTIDLPAGLTDDLLDT